MSKNYYFFGMIGSLIIGIALSYAAFVYFSKPESETPQEKLSSIVEARDNEIRMAQARGDYRCCIEPPCTMCYMEANQWNNYTAGTCACDDLIKQGKKPCPQCGQSLSCDSQGEQAINCEIDIEQN